jgi:hypothetical protein
MSHSWFDERISRHPALTAITSDERRRLSDTLI